MRASEAVRCGQGIGLSHAPKAKSTSDVYSCRPISHIIDITVNDMGWAMSRNYTSRVLVKVVGFNP